MFSHGRLESRGQLTPTPTPTLMPTLTPTLTPALTPTLIPTVTPTVTLTFLAANGKLESRGYVGNPAVTLPPNALGKLQG